MTVIYHPPTFVNQYLQEKVATKYASLNLGSLPLFPTMPTDIASLALEYRHVFDALQTGLQVPVTNEGLAGIYDRMFRMRRGPFPHIKCEQLLYYFYATTMEAPAKIIYLQQVISDLFDNGDESAEDINRWIAALPDGAETEVDGKVCKTKRLYNASRTSYEDMPMPYFHNFKIYQLQETRDIVDFGTARTYAGNKIIIEYDWHKSY